MGRIIPLTAVLLCLCLLISTAVFADELPAAAQDSNELSAGLSDAEPNTTQLPAAANYNDAVVIEAHFPDAERPLTCDFVYSDDFFSLPSDQYNHDFARLSMGLAMAAFRDEQNKEMQDHALIEFLNSLGFSQIESETYRTDPTSDSIAYGLATKKIGDTTVLVCAVCGGGYGMEWASNLTVGDDERSDGFEEASEKVQAAVNDYINRKNLADEKVKLWIAGYSRGAAVSNLTAADLIASGRFADVYAYTFATPRTTREPIAYPNIFNIINKEDIVPKIPLSEWGYQRYGNDLFIVSPETDSDCDEIMERAAEIHLSMSGAEIVENPEITYQLRILFDYLLMLMSDSATYTEHLQPLLIKFMTEEDGMKDALQVLFKSLKEYKASSPEAEEELTAMLDYLGTLIGVYYFQENLAKLPADQWDPALGALNLFYAHLAPRYLSFLYATDDPEALYSDNMEYIRLIIYGDDVKISISDGTTVIKEVLANGTEMVDGKRAPYSFPDTDYYDGKVIVAVPADQVYEVTVTSRGFLPQTVSYTGLRFSCSNLRAEADDVYSYIMNPGDSLVIRTSTDGKAIEASGSDYMDISLFTEAIYSPTTAMRMENNTIYHMNISRFMNNLIVFVIALLAQLALSIILLIRRKKKHLKRHVIVSLVWHGAMLFAFAVLEIAMWFFVPVFPILKIVMAIIVFVILFAYARKGCSEHRRNWKVFWKYILCLAVFMVLQNLLIGDFTGWKAILLLIVYGGFMAWAFLNLWQYKKSEKKVLPDPKQGPEPA